MWSAHSISRGSGSSRSPTADRTRPHLRRSGGDRDRKRAADHRDSGRRWNSRPRPPRCCRSSTPRPAIWRRCSMPSWKRRCGCARPRSASSAPMTVTCCDLSQRAACRRVLRGVPDANRTGPSQGGIAHRIVARRAYRSCRTISRTAMPTALAIRLAAHMSIWAACAPRLYVPLRKDDALLGLIVIYRRRCGLLRQGDRAAARTSPPRR